MPRIYSNYSQSDFDIVIKLSKELGFSASAFQHYCVMLYADQRGSASPLNTLKTTMMSNLGQLKSGDTFIVSALVADEWPSLSRSDKMCLAKQLSLHIKTHPRDYEVFRSSKGQATLYKKK